MPPRSGPTKGAYWWSPKDHPADPDEITATADEWVELDPEGPRFTGLLDQFGRKIVSTPRVETVEYFGFVPIDEKE